MCVGLLKDPTPRKTGTRVCIVRNVRARSFMSKQILMKLGASCLRVLLIEADFND